jgi:hypothetical protein
MIGPANGVRIWLACGVTDLQREMDSLAEEVRNWLRILSSAGRSCFAGGGEI